MICGKSGQPHINLDPRGFPSRNNPHIEVPGFVVHSIPFVQKSIRVVSKGIDALGVDAYRLYNSVQEDINYKQQIELSFRDTQQALREIRDCLEKNDQELSEEEIEYLRDQLKELESLLNKLNAAKNQAPRNTIQTGALIADGWTGGMSPHGRWCDRYMGCRSNWCPGRQLSGARWNTAVHCGRCCDWCTWRWLHW